MDLVIAMNLAFNLVIVCLGAFAYVRAKNVLVLSVSIGFCFFAISYILTIAGFGSSVVLIPLRAFGYLTIIAGLYLQGTRSKSV